MRVITVKTKEDRTRYYLADGEGMPVEPVLRYLKFRDNRGYARNTLRMDCQHMKQYFTYLETRSMEYTDVTLDELAGFIAWLKNPHIYEKVMPLLRNPVRKSQTINNIMGTVIMFYDYLSRHEEYENVLQKGLVKFIRNQGGNYKSFLHGIADSKMMKCHMLKLQVPHMGLRTIKKEDAAELLKACTNLRDYFLLYLLFETGMRIGEVLSLWLEDFDLSKMVLVLQDKGEMENQAEIKTVSSPRCLNATQELMDLFQEYVCTYHTQEVVTNHVLIKLRGNHAGKAMDYTDVDNLFRILRNKTGIQVTPHMFRHTSLSLLHSAGWGPELLRKRAGHKNIYTTMNTYVHPTDEEVAEAFYKASVKLKPVGLDAEVYGK